MELSNETIDLIRKEANKKFYPVSPLSQRSAYIQGASEWAIWKQKADAFEKALRTIARGNDNGQCEVAIKALEQFK